MLQNVLFPVFFFFNGDLFVAKDPALSVLVVAGVYYFFFIVYFVYSCI